MAVSYMKANDAKLISIDVLKKDFPVLNYFKDEDLKKPAYEFKLFGRSMIYDRMKFYAHSGFRNKYAKNACHADQFRLADFIASYEMMKMKDPGFNMMEIDGIGLKTNYEIEQTILNLSDGKYDLYSKINKCSKDYHGLNTVELCCGKCGGHTKYYKKFRMYYCGNCGTWNTIPKEETDDTEIGGIK